MQLKDISTINPRTTLKISNLPSIKYIDTSSVIDGKLENIQELTSNYPSRAQRLIRENDILISSVRPNLKHNFFVTTKQSDCIASSGFLQVRITDNKYNPRFIYYFLTTQRMIDLYSSIAETSQTTFPSFNKDVLENVELPYVSLEEQKHIIDIISFALKCR